jgi:hypothetical protein
VKFNAMPSDTPIAVMAKGIAIRWACMSAKRKVQNGNSVMGVTPFSGVGMMLRERLGSHQLYVYANSRKLASPKIISQKPPKMTTAGPTRGISGFHGLTVSKLR